MMAKRTYPRLKSHQIHPRSAHHRNRYAEMAKEEKNKISHRSRALEKLQAWFAERKES